MRPDEQWCGATNPHPPHEWILRPGPGELDRRLLCHGRSETTEQAMTDDKNAAEHELRGWWRDTARIDEDAVVPKAIEYSAVDLEIIGRGLMAFNPGLWAETPEDERASIAAEMGATFYTLGKVARAIGAFSEGRRPSADTWHDTTVYSMMARRIQDTGRWGP